VRQASPPSRPERQHFKNIFDVIEEPCVGKDDCAGIKQFPEQTRHNDGIRRAEGDKQSEEEHMDSFTHSSTSEELRAAHVARS